jgi:radical SAM superfamily enzyme YgiQ (UPF0313 family)
MWTTRWSARDPTDVLDEMGWAIDTYGAGNFDFYDLTLVVRKDWLREFCHGLIERNYDVTWQVPSGTRSEALDAEVLPLMRRAGCNYLPYAPESGSPAVLKRIKKKVDLDNMKASMRAAVEAGISVKCNMIIGFPGETREDVRETIRFCWDLAEIGVHDVNMGPFVPYPGSELFEELTANGRLQKVDDDYFDMLANYSDLGNSQSWSEHMDDRVMHTARFAAMATFYARSFARRPGRLLSLARNVRSGRHQTRLDRAVADLMVRWSAVGREQLSRLIARGGTVE